MVHRGLVSSTGRSDYIYAGTQVLLNTPFFALRLPLASPHPAPPRPSFFPSSPRVQSRYKWLFAVQLPQHVCICLHVSPTACKTEKKIVPFFTHKLLLGTQKAPEWRCQSAIRKVCAGGGGTASLSVESTEPRRVFVRVSTWHLHDLHPPHLTTSG